jgi:m7GpppX diphosphatase
MAGMLAGQAHLLDDLIFLVSLLYVAPRMSLTGNQLEISPPLPEQSIPNRMTLTYALGVEHGLYALLLRAGEEFA